MASSVTEGHIKKLRGAGYLAANIAHRLPAAGQIVPTPEPGFNDDESGAQYCLQHCKAGSFSEYITEEFEYEDSVRPCKISSTFHRRENNIFANLIC